MDPSRTGFRSLPVETIEYIARLARENDTKRRIGNASSSKKQGGSKGHARRKSELWKADSAVCLARTCKSLSDIVLPVIWRSVDFTDVPAFEHAYVAGLLANGRGHQVRKLQLSIRLLPISNDKLQASSTRAVSTEIAVQILSSVPRLEWLEIELCSMNSPHYISKLSQSLKAALATHTQLKHFGITCEGQVNDVLFQLDETLVADVVAGFPNLASLTFHRVGRDLLLDTSPLFDVISSLKDLRKLNILEVQALNELWTLKPIRGGLSSLTIVCCHHLSPSGLDKLLEMNKTALSALFLVHTPSRDHHFQSGTASNVKYDLPALRSLYIEAERSHINSISYIERFSDTNLEELSLRYVAGVREQELEDLLKSRRFKSLKRVEIGRCGLANMREQSLDDLVQIAKGVGVELSVGGQSALAADTVM